MQRFSVMVTPSRQLVLEPHPLVLTRRWVRLSRQQLMQTVVAQQLTRAHCYSERKLQGDCDGATDRVMLETSDSLPAVSDAVR